MAFHVVYRMVAKEGQKAALADALRSLREIVLACPAADRVEILSSLDKDDTLLLIEHWQSKKLYGEAASQIPKSVFDPVKAALGASPAREEFETIA